MSALAGPDPRAAPDECGRPPRTVPGTPAVSFEALGQIRAATMTTRFVLILCVAAFCSACVPTTQIQYYRTRGDISISKDPGTPLEVALRTPILSPMQKGEIDTTASYARDSSGRKFGIQTTKNAYEESYPVPSYFLQRQLWLVSSGRQRRGWPNDRWQLHVELVSPRGREIYEADFRLWLLIWTPFLGPPN
jgi:hypothetical protein